ncbi:hypothetical protein CEY16_07695 [Halalkalibacillus sediminis]|uniref:Polysaccharide biosynthesis protein CapD-like domain-containing protein n=1 Tax=Halalkalibacillus sediminis TaxID=2018042 RepID=A0A2I0QTY0_9BACI|nr:nucleoside-diphosphate sugar epimerase/dehydratase [Halalkalibacillus sediminis]PKR77805.1 hypothetical protein CEY16_07695 [Halalkalibacillus sediminis]
MKYHQRLSLLILLDSVIVLSAIYISSYLLYSSPTLTTNIVFLSSIILVLAHHLFAIYLKLYQKAWEYASIGELITIFNVVTYSVVLTVIAQYISFGMVMTRAMVITWMLHILLIGGSRFAWRVFRDHYWNPTQGKKRTLIIGAGSAGVMVARQLFNSIDTELKPIAFLDDDPAKKKMQIYGVSVAGKIKHLEKVVEEMSIEHIIIAIPSLDNKRLKEIFSHCSKTKVKTQIIPMLEDIVTGRVSMNEVRDVQVEDLLGRDPVELDIQGISEYITENTVLITGAGGSIGSEICRQISVFEPKQLILLGHGENSIYQIERELRGRYQNRFEIIPIIADVQDRKRIFEVMETYQPHVVYHAAAHKHVPLMEYNPMEAVKNNIFGTKNVAEAAKAIEVNTFVLVSTDKAVNPTNVMGATKRIAEMVIQSLAQDSKTKFLAVRFGNVLGSRGSVIPLFKEQIKIGGPVTVTHPEMTRYFMTIPEASRLVVQSGPLARGGEIFVLDMGEPVKIVDLATNLIKLSGHSLDDIEIEYSGIRPGEKMYEELLGDDEIMKKQVFPKIHIGKSTFDEFQGILDEVNSLPKIEQNRLKEHLFKLISTEHKQAKETV